MGDANLPFPANAILGLDFYLDAYFGAAKDLPFINFLIVVYVFIRIATTSSSLIHYLPMFGKIDSDLVVINFLGSSIFATDDLMISRSVLQDAVSSIGNMFVRNKLLNALSKAPEAVNLNFVLKFSGLFSTAEVEYFRMISAENSIKNSAKIISEFLDRHLVQKLRSKAYIFYLLFFFILIPVYLLTFAILMPMTDTGVVYS